jgi:hypothetical protein
MKDVADDMCMHIAHVLRLVDTETSEDVQALVLVPDVQVQGVQKLCTCPRGNIALRHLWKVIVGR